MKRIPEDWPQEIRVVFAGVGKDLTIVGTSRGSSRKTAVSRPREFYYVKTGPTITKQELQALVECPLFRHLVATTRNGFPTNTLCFKEDT